MLRQRLFTIVQRARPGDKLSHYYDMFITAVALISVIPLMFKDSTPLLDMLDVITVYILFADYIFRWATHDLTTGRPGWKAFARYPFGFFAIFDFLSLLPSLGLLGQGFRILRVFRITKAFRYSKSFINIEQAIMKERKTLGTVVILAVAYIFLSALTMFTYEPETFDNFFMALYWATTALTTVGYGDIYPVTMLGKFISMASSLFGIAIIALPAGIITASFMDVINAEKKKEEEIDE